MKTISSSHIYLSITHKQIATTGTPKSKQIVWSSSSSDESMEDTPPKATKISSKSGSGKVSSKIPVTKGRLKGKDGKTVSFDTSDSEVLRNSSKSGGKDSFGTKGGKSGKAEGKSTMAKPAVPKLNVEEELPSNTSCLMDCEAAAMLEGIHGQLTLLSNDSTIKIPGYFEKGLQYANSVNRYTDAKSTRQMLEKLKRHNISDSEICLIANVSPETVPEVYALVPSLKSEIGAEKTIREVLQELAGLKECM